jgi:hypothetical protein
VKTNLIYTTSMSSSDESKCTQTTAITGPSVDLGRTVCTLFWIHGIGTWKDKSRTDVPSFQAAVQTKAEVPLAMQSAINRWKQIPDESPEKAVIRQVEVHQLKYTVHHMEQAMLALMNGRSFTPSVWNTAVDKEVFTLKTPQEIDAYLY